MEDPTTMLAIASVGVAGLGVSSAAALKGWNGWLALKRLQLAGRRGGAAPPPSATARIELADLKERVRKLEAIANGVEL